MIASHVMRNSNKLAQRRMLATKSTFSDISRDALEGGIKYSPLIVTAIGIVTFITGITLEFSSLQSQITLANEKIISIEQVNERIMDAKIKSTDEKIKSTDEKIKSVELANEKIIDEKVKAIDEKINASVEKSVRVALENFFKYSYSNEFKGLRRDTKSDEK